MTRIAATALATLLLAAPLGAEEAARQPEATTAITPQTGATARTIMVAAANPLAAEAGRAVLARGGSAADAAVAIQMVLNLAEPQSSGIGGGAFALYWNAALAELTTLDGRETAPAAATPDYWLGPDGEPLGFWDAVVGGRSAGVPGTLKLMEDLHARYGRLPWSELLQPAIELAETGLTVSPRMAASIAEAQEDGLDRFDATRAYFFDDTGAPLAEGTTLTNPAFARTLRLIAEHGSAPFYEGAIARDIVAAVRTETNPGILTLADLAAYEVIERAPVCLDYRDFEICGMGPPSSGALTVGQILGQLASFDLAALGDGAQATHLLLEASKNAFADRNLYMADADFVAMPEGLLDPDYLASRAALIDPAAAMPEATPGTPPWDDTQLRAPDTERPRAGTTHFVIVDSYGDMASITSTIESGFGSRVMTNGFLLNNELTDFSFEPEIDGVPVANRVEGSKRPRSSMAPTIVLQDGAPVLLVGSPGGSRIIPYVASTLVGILDFDLAPQDAIDRPHILNRNGPTDIEEGPGAEATATALAALGHETMIRDLNSGLHVIAIAPDGTLTGAADKRREGVVLGD